MIPALVVIVYLEDQFFYIILEVDRTVTRQKWEVLENLKYPLQIDILVDFWY